MFEYITDDDRMSIEATIIYALIGTPILFGVLVAILLTSNNILRVGLIIAVLGWFKSEQCWRVGTLPGALMHHYRFSHS
jgi:hypothetical protein